MTRAKVVLTLEALVVICGIVVFLIHPSAAWVETRFINGYYPGLQSALGRMTSIVPFAAGDVITISGIVLILARAVVWWRRRKEPRRLRLARFILDTAAVCALFGIGFYAGWGWCYERNPVTDRAQFDAARINARAVQTLKMQSLAQINRLAPIAHRADHAPALGALAADVQVIAGKLGDRGTFYLGAPKRSLIDFYLTAAGVGGYVSPYSGEAIAASDVLWFEEPDFVAHEWSHLAGFAREDEANYIAVLACLRSPDPVIRYSGWLQLYLYLYQPSDKITRRTFVKEVWDDIAAIRARNQAHVNLSLSSLQWRFYNNYLQANHVKNGTVSYSQFVTLYIGSARTPDGLPIPRADTSR